MYHKGEIIAYELDEFNEVNFCTRGEVVVGYEINHIKKYSLKLSNTVILGAYYVTFKRKS